MKTGGDRKAKGGGPGSFQIQLGHPRNRHRNRGRNGGVTVFFMSLIFGEAADRGGPGVSGRGGL